MQDTAVGEHKGITFLSLLLESNNNYSSICKHFYQYLKCRDERLNESPPSTTLPIMMIQLQNKTLINPIKIDPQCYCTTQEDQFYVQCHVYVWQDVQPNASPPEPSSCVIRTDTIRLIKDIQIAKSVTIREKHVSEYLKRMLTATLRHQIVAPNSFMFFDQKVIKLGSIESEQDFSVEQSKVYLVTDKTQIILAQDNNKNQLLSHSALMKREYMQSKEIANVLVTLDKLVRISIEWKKIFPSSLFSPPCGILIKSDSSNNVSSLIKYVVQKYKPHYSHVSLREVSSSYVGDTESSLRNIFSSSSLVPILEYPIAIIYLESVDKICGKRSDQQNTQQNRIVGQLLTLMDGIKTSAPRQEIYAPVLVIASTDQPKNIDEALRRPGRFDYEMWMYTNPQVQLSSERCEMLQQFFSPFPLHSSLTNKTPWKTLAEDTKGFSKNDLEKLCKETFIQYLQRIRATKEQRGIHREDINSALLRVRPSHSISSINATPIKWEDIGGLQETKNLLKRSIEWPLKYSKQFSRMNLKAPKGILLYGPPGCCKTTLVKAAAHSSQAAFLPISGAEIYSPYFGASENLIRDKFREARSLQPCLLFIDEIEAIVGKREQEGDDCHGIQQRILSTLLNELDGIGTLEGDIESNSVILVAATNRPDMIDSALLRPGRLDNLIYVPKPTKEERTLIFEVKTKNLPLAEDVDVVYLASQCDGYTGADIDNLCREAALCALQENIFSISITNQNFAKALQRVNAAKQLTQDTDDNIYISFFEGK